MTKPVNDHEGFMRKATTKRVVMINSLLLGLIGFGHVVAETAGTAQPAWPPSSQPAPGFAPPPPGPYGASPAQGAEAPSFAPAPSPTPAPSRTGMTREEFLEQRDAHRKAMQAQREQRQAQYQQQAPAAPAVSAPMTKEEMDKRWEEMRAEHEKRMQEAMAARPRGPEDMQKQMEEMRSEREQQMPQEMQQQMAEARKRHQARYEAIQSKEAEIRQLLDQVREKQREMQEMFRGMSEERSAHAATFRPAESAKAPAVKESAAPAKQAQAPYPAQRPATPYGPAYGYPPAPYGYYNRAPMPAYPYVQPAAPAEAAR